ncbi:MAG: TetR/AcrR family transcriptional regulator [Gemmatimonadetes bacterium]|nr:TetR/AcrR family transcriptional regulator [Gemmatimonadota bacterium]
MTHIKRPYRSPRRREQAQETRRKILAAARELFVKRGYGGSTMDAIAQGAGVAVQTVYASLGSKKGILLALLDEMAEDADLSGMRAAVAAAAGDPPRQLRERLAFTTRFFAGGADIIDIARTVSGVESDLKEMWNEGEGRRHERTEALVAEWEAAGALAPGVAAREGTDLMWALCGPDVFRLLVTERGWSQEQFQERIASILESVLFAFLHEP